MLSSSVCVFARNLTRITNLAGVTEAEVAATASFVISEKLRKTAGAIAFQSSLLRVPGKTVVLMRQEGEQFDVYYHCG